MGSFPSPLLGVVLRSRRGVQAASHTEICSKGAPKKGSIGHKVSSWFARRNFPRGHEETEGPDCPRLGRITEGTNGILLFPERWWVRRDALGNSGKHLCIGWL